jgi:hypothetical protein
MNKNIESLENIATVQRVEVEEGGLYEVMGEDSLLTCFCCGVIAVTDKGEFRHSTFVERGHGYSEREGVNYANPNARSNAQRFADKVSARGQIDLTYWEPVRRVSLEARLDRWALEEMAERMGVPCPA